MPVQTRAMFYRPVGPTEFDAVRLEEIETRANEAKLFQKIEDRKIRRKLMKIQKRNERLHPQRKNKSEKPVSSASVAGRNNRSLNGQAMVSMIKVKPNRTRIFHPLYASTPKPREQNSSDEDEQENLEEETKDFETFVKLAFDDEEEEEDLLLVSRFQCCTLNCSPQVPQAAPEVKVNVVEDPCKGVNCNPRRRHQQ